MDDLFTSRSGPVRFGSHLTESLDDSLHRELIEDVHSDTEDSNIITGMSNRKRRHYSSDESSDESRGDGNLADRIMSGRVKLNKIEKDLSQTNDDKMKEELTMVNDSSSDSSSSPTNSPHHYRKYYIPDDESQQLLLAADNALSKLRHDSSSTLTDYNDSSLIHTPQTPEQCKLRVRCNGKVYKYSLGKNDPLSIIYINLSSDLNVDPSQVLLQLKSCDVNKRDTPTSLQLTSVDILDAFVLNTTIPPSITTTIQAPPTSSEICIKVQTSDKKCFSYNIGKENKFESIFKRFSADIGTSVNNIQFSFDGELISSEQSPDDLDIENNDIIDARLL